MQIKLFENLSLPSVFKSKRFWVAVIGLATMLITPENATVEMAGAIAEVQDAVLVIVLALIGGYTVQDTASALAGKNKYIDGQ